jgi:hypothetical protein
VLLLHSFEREFAPFDTFAGLFRTELSRQSSTPIDFLEVSVRPGPFTDSPEEAPVVSYILAALAGHGVDLIGPSADRQPSKCPAPTVSRNAVDPRQCVSTLRAECHADAE